MPSHYPSAPLTRHAMLHAVGIGNWRQFVAAGYTINNIIDAIVAWRRAVSGCPKLWLCWSVDPDWSLEQQRQVISVGWTPLVGHDPRTAPPPLLPGSIYVDFNAQLRLPVMFPHFPIELAQFWIPVKLAFWHSDLLVRPVKLHSIAELFEGLSNGQMAAVKPRFSLREAVMGRLRYWELIGCTTKGAAAAAFEAGCGWWMGWPWHPMNPETERDFRKIFYWDHGAGIRYWHKRCGGQVVLIPERYVAEGHCTGIGRPDYQRSQGAGLERDLTVDLARNFNLTDTKRRLGIA